MAATTIAGLNITATRNGSRMSSSVSSLSGTSLLSSTQFVYSSGWGGYIELEAALTVSTTTGSLAIYCNGTLVANLTDINTQGSAGATVGYVGTFSNSINNPSNGEMFVDDLYASDTVLSSLCGPMGPRVMTLAPIANVQAQWTPSTSGDANWQMVSETNFDGDATYVSTTTAGAQDLYEVATAPSASMILAVQTSIVARMDDSGTREISGSIESGGVIYQGATRTLTANYENFVDMYMNDPATGAAWAASKFTTSGNVNVGVLCVE